MDNMDRPTGERIAKLEQHMQDQDTKLSEIAGDIKEIKATLQLQTTLRDEIRNLKTEVATLKKANGLWAWVKIMITGAATSVLTILIASYLDKLK